MATVASVIDIINNPKFLPVFYMIVFCLGLPANCWGLYRLYRLFQSGSRVSVYIINLLLADLLQLATLPTLIYALLNDVFYGYIIIRNYTFLFVSQGSIAWFLVLVSLERYLAITRPACYHRIQRLRCALPIALGVWGLCSFIFIFHILYISWNPQFVILYILSGIVIVLYYLLPLILLVFSCVGTWRTRAASVPDAERRSAVWMVAFTLLIFTVVYSPCVLTLIVSTTSAFADIHFHSVHPFIIVKAYLLTLTAFLSPLLCLFLRESPRDTGDCRAEQGDTGQEEPDYESISSV